MYEVERILVNYSVTKLPEHLKSGGIFALCRYAQSCAFISVIELPRIPAYCPKLTPQKWGVIFNYIFPKTLLIRLAVKRSKGSILYNISK